MLRRKPEVFAPTDGVLSVVGAVQPPRGADYSDPSAYETAYTLAFRRMRISSRDVELSDMTGCEITAKVEVRNPRTLYADTDVLMSGAVYEVTRVEDRGPTLWLWLSEVACDGTCDLIGSTVTYDEYAVPHTAGTNEPVYVRRASNGSKRRDSAGVDALEPTVTLRIRTADYAHERSVRCGSVTYTVLSTETHGRWTDLKCRERGADRG